MPGALQSKGDGEYAYSAPFTGLDASKPSIILPPSAQDIQTSPSFAIQRGSIAAPWPVANNVFGWTPLAGEYLLFATPSGYIFTNLRVLQFTSTATAGTAWEVISVTAMLTGAFPATQLSNKEISFVETNGCVYFASQIGVLRFASATNQVQRWAVGFAPLYLTISNERMIVVGTTPSAENDVPGTPSGTAHPGTGTVPAGVYYAIITAVFLSGTEGPPSAESVGVTLGSVGEIVWTWTAVPNAVSYNVYVGNAPGQESSVYPATGTSFTFDNFTASTTFITPTATPISPYTIAWSAISTFSSTSVGIFNANPNTLSGTSGGFDVLTNYSQGLPVGIINLGHSFYVVMTQGIVEVDPAQSGTAPFTFYNFWQERIPVGAMPGTLDQFGPISCFVTPDNVNVWVPGSQTQIGGPIMPYLRSILRNVVAIEDQNAQFPLLQGPPTNASFYTMYNELHYALSFNVFGVPPQQFAPPYPNQVGEALWFGLILDYNFASQAWTIQRTGAITTRLFQVNGPPLSQTTYSAIPTQTLLIAGTQAAGPGTQGGVLCFAGDVFNELVFGADQCQALSSVPQTCYVGFPQTPISSGRTPAIRRVRIEYSVDELSCGGAAAPTTLTVSMQGVNCANNNAPNTTANAATALQSVTTQVVLNPIGAVGVSPFNKVVPFLTSVAYADFTLSIQNPQISLSWTDPAPDVRYLIHRVTPEVDDTQGTLA